MVNIIVGLLFIVLSLTFPYSSQELKTVMEIDILPDFIGYLVLWFGLEKVAVRNRRFKDCSTFAAVLMAVSFIMFVGQISFLLPFDIGESRALHAIFDVVNTVFQSVPSIYAAVTVLFLSFLSFSFISELSDSKKTYFTTVFRLFSALFLAVAVFCAVRQFVDMPVETWMFTVPVGLLFTAAAGFACKEINEWK